MTDVLLITAAADNRKVKKRKQPQLGLAYIGASLLRAGIDVKVLDADLEALSADQIADRVGEIAPLAVGITGCTDDRFWMYRALAAVRARQPEALLFAGGPHFSATATAAIEALPELDAVVVGEGERITVEMIQRFQRDRSRSVLADLDNTVSRQEGKAHLGPQVVEAPPLNELPEPAWELFEMDRYQGYMLDDVPIRTAGVISTRGCPFSCSFCYNARNKRIRRLSPQLFVDQIELLIDRYGFPGINIQDDSFLSDPIHVQSICDEINRRKIHFKWFCSLRIDSAYKHPELLAVMRNAGCIALGFGVEFADNAVLQLMHKGATVEMMESVLSNVAALEFPKVSMFLLNSLPGQTIDNTYKASLRLQKFFRILGLDQTRIPIGTWARIYPGTELERLASESGTLPEDFSWYKDYCSPWSDKLGLMSPYVPIYELPDLSPLEILAASQRANDMAHYMGILGSCRCGSILRTVASREGSLGLAQAAYDYCRTRLS